MDIFWLSNYVKQDCLGVLFVRVCGGAERWPDRGAKVQPVGRWLELDLVPQSLSKQ